MRTFIKVKGMKEEIQLYDSVRRNMDTVSKLFNALDECEIEFKMTIRLEREKTK